VVRSKEHAQQSGAKTTAGVSFGFGCARLERSCPHPRFSPRETIQHVEHIQVKVNGQAEAVASHDLQAGTKNTATQAMRRPHLPKHT